MAYGIQNTSHMKKGAENPILTIRLNDAEHLRFWNLMDTAKSRNPYTGKSDVVRELMGLNPPTVLTETEIAYFRTGQQRPRSVILRPQGENPRTIPLGTPNVAAEISGGTSEQRHDLQQQLEEGIPVAAKGRTIPAAKPQQPHKKQRRA